MALISRLLGILCRELPKPIRTCPHRWTDWHTEDGEPMHVILKYERWHIRGYDFSRLYFAWSRECSLCGVSYTMLDDESGARLHGADECPLVF